MKLRNKKTGEIVIYSEGIVDLNKIGCKNVAEMMDAGWEDYEEPKDIWWLDNEGNVNHTTREINYCFEKNREIGNYFETREEAEKAVEKLKALKRLRDKGFKFNGTTTSCYENHCIEYETKFDYTSHYDKAEYKEMEADLDLLFGGEE